MTDGELTRYIGAVEKVRSARIETLDDATRRKIAEELGLSAADMAGAAAAGEANLIRAEGLIASGSWDEALRNLEEADALLRDDVRVAHALARAHWGRFYVGPSKADRERALAQTYIVPTAARGAASRRRWPWGTRATAWSLRPRASTSRREDCA